MSSQQVTSIRDEYKAQTRERILDAAINLMSSGPEADVRIADIAQAAGVTERTVYRHFETRDDLMNALWPKMQERVGSPGFPKSASDLIASPRALYPSFDRHEGLVAASLHSPSGQEVRRRSNVERQQAHLAIASAAFPTLDEATLRRRAAVLQLLNSAFAWEAMRNFWDLDGKEAGEACAEAIEILLTPRPPSKD